MKMNKNSNSKEELGLIDSIISGRTRKYINTKSFLKKLFSVKKT